MDNKRLGAAIKLADALGDCLGRTPGDDWIYFRTKESAQAFKLKFPEFHSCYAVHSADEIEFPEV